VNQVVDIATLVLIVAGITVLVRPGSQGPTLVQNLFQGFQQVVGTASSFNN
jgi:hypothetical protein